MTASILLFPSHVVVSNHNYDKDTILNEIYQEIDKDSIGVEASNNGGYHSDYHCLIDNHNITSLINPIIEYHIKNYFGFKQGIRWEYDSFWINVNPPHTSNSPHTHLNCELSGVFFVNIPNNSGKLRFYNPNTMYSLSAYKSQETMQLTNEYNCYTWSPTEGDIIIFPNTLQHDVDINMSTEDRISIAFNLKLS